MPQENSSPLLPVAMSNNNLVDSAMLRQSPPESQENSSPLLSNNAVNTALNTIPVFDGKPGEYSIFMQLFDVLVHKNDKIPMTLKHALLLRLLSGEAKSMLQSVTLSEADYYVLRDSLERQYNREEDTKQNPFTSSASSLSPKTVSRIWRRI
ncbi:hypothetical protein CRE_15806 [Caenorhabditis remanei]|uniref:Uncharacterized protein n=1 Tax=Caenorhabditis remanei TaxID=31234 RepID=E3NNN8_CAERE|nr:hypothetical protein CRE_15806 [Caenorhabditis remanei]